MSGTHDTFGYTCELKSLIIPSSMFWSDLGVGVDNLSFSTECNRS